MSKNYIEEFMKDNGLGLGEQFEVMGEFAEHFFKNVRRCFRCKSVMCDILDFWSDDIIEITPKVKLV